MMEGYMLVVLIKYATWLETVLYLLKRLALMELLNGLQHSRMNIVVICIGILLIPRYLFPPTTSCFISKGDYDESSIVILDTTGNYYYDYNHFLDFDNDDFDEYYLFEKFNTDYALLSEIAV